VQSSGYIYLQQERGISPQTTGENDMTDKEAVELIIRRAIEISKSPLFAEAVKKAGCKTEEEVKELGYKLAIATLVGQE
jgi:hypothetical protein